MEPKLNLELAFTLFDGHWSTATIPAGAGYWRAASMKIRTAMIALRDGDFRRPVLKHMFSFNKKPPITSLGDNTKAAIERYARDYFASSDAQDELRAVGKAIIADGTWENDDEWRVMTWSKTVIRKNTEREKDWYYVSVECDGQTLGCRCPHLGRAHFFSRWYRHLIVYQFYSVGPTWGEVVKK